MYLTEQYNLYQLASHLIGKEGFQLLHINSHTDEIWLEKQNRKASTVIRFSHKGFDWKNHLKTDIAKVFQHVSVMNSALSAKQIDIFNVYITEHEPIDDWEMLKKPMILKQKKSLQMNIFYLSDEAYHHEKNRLFKKMAITEPSSEVIPDEEICKDIIQQHQQSFKQLMDNRIKQIRGVFSYGKPRFVYLFLFINICLFLFLEWNGGSTNSQTLIQYGAKYNPAISNGEWWRLISSMFLHIGLLHLVINMFALYYLGVAVEKIFGSFRFIIIYFLAGIGGSIASFSLNPHIAAGASGALFGLFAALLYFGMVHRTVFAQTMKRNIIILLLINLMIGLLIPQIDMSAHLGGLIFGYLAAVITSLPNIHRIQFQTLAIICYAVLIISLLYYSEFSF